MIHIDLLQAAAEAGKTALREKPMGIYNLGIRIRWNSHGSFKSIRPLDTDRPRKGLTAGAIRSGRLRVQVRPRSDRPTGVAAGAQAAELRAGPMHAEAKGGAKGPGTRKDPSGHALAEWGASMDEGRSSNPRDRMHVGAVSMKFATTSSTRLQGRMTSMKMVPLPMAGVGQTAHQVNWEFGHASVTDRRQRA